MQVSPWLVSHHRLHRSRNLEQRTQRQETLSRKDMDAVSSEQGFFMQKLFPIARYRLARCNHHPEHDGTEPSEVSAFEIRSRS
jgi:hypothetical protein